jgi:hypothetical protein
MGNEYQWSHTMSFPRYPVYKDSGVEWLGCARICGNKTRQGYARKRILKLAGYFFVG